MILRGLKMKNDYKESFKTSCEWTHIHFKFNHRAKDILKEVDTNRNIYKAKFTAALFLVAKNWKKWKESINRVLKCKLWNIHIMDNIESLLKSHIALHDS